MAMTRSMAAVAAILAAATLVRQGAAQDEQVAIQSSETEGPCDDSAATVAILNGTGVNTSACIGASADGECQAVCAAGYAALGEGASSTAFTCSTDTFVKKEGEGDLVCGAQACTTDPSGSDIDHSDCDGKVTGETCQVACATGLTGAAASATCGADGAFAYASAAPSCVAATGGGGDSGEAAACNATGYSDLTAWFDDIAEHVTTLSEIEGEAAKKDAFVKDMLPSLKAKICENKAALEEVSWGSTCDMITTEAVSMVMGDSACLCGGKCEAMWEVLTQEDEGEEDSDPFADPTEQECRYANCYVTEACAAAGTDMEPMMDNLTAMVGSKCGSYLSALVDGAEPTRGPFAPSIAAMFAGLMALF